MFDGEMSKNSFVLSENQWNHNCPLTGNSKLTDEKKVTTLIKSNDT